MAKDPTESKNVFESRPEVAKRLVAVFEKWSKTVDASDEGKDYDEGHLTDPDPRRIFWVDHPDALLLGFDRQSFENDVEKNFRNCNKLFARIFGKAHLGVDLVGHA